VATFVRYGKAFAAFCPAGGQHATAIGSTHAFAKPMLISSFPLRWLKCSLHDALYIFMVFSNKCANVRLNRTNIKFILKINAVWPTAGANAYLSSMNVFKHTIAAVAVLFSVAPLVARQDPTTPYRIYDTRAEREISLPELVDAMQHVDVVFFGEEHNDSVAHVLQYELLRAMNERYDSVALSMEMLVSDDQLVLDEYLAGLITELNFRRDAVLWKNYDDYRPVVEYAKTQQLKVLAANAPSRYTNRVTRGGLESLEALSDAAKALLAPLPIDTLTGAYHEKFNTLLGEHQSMATLKIYQSQTLWDATMAYRIGRFAGELPGVKILHLTGRFHSDEKLGTVAQLARYAPALRVCNISCFSHMLFFDDPQWESFRHLGDYVILTDPSVDRTF